MNYINLFLIYVSHLCLYAEVVELWSNIFAYGSVRPTACPSRYASERVGTRPLGT